MRYSIFLCVLFFFLCFRGYPQTVDSTNYAKFGKIKIYHPKELPKSIALFVSGDGGWKFGVLNMARNIALQGALVVGIDAKHYANYMANLKTDCLYPAADFEELSMDIQKKYKFDVYQKPILIGYSYGAVLVYSILAQSPANTFKGAIALGFCPDITTNKPFCMGNGLKQHVLKPKNSYYLEATKTLTAPFIVLNGVKDKTCLITATTSYLHSMPMAELVTLPKVGHGFSIADNWLPQFNTAYKKIVDLPAKADNTSVGKISFNTISSDKKSNLPFIFMISGDGGWTSFDQSLAESLAALGFHVAGLDAQKYFWNAKTPESSSVNLVEAIVHYQEKFGEDNFVLTGYPFGASVVPFLANRLPEIMKNHLKGVISLSPDVSADFEIHVSNMLDIGSPKGKYDVIAEMKKIKSVKPVCIFGNKEGNNDMKKFINNHIKVITIPGSHHYNKDYPGIAKIIKQQIN